MHVQRRATALDVWCCDDEEDGCGSAEAALDDALFGFDEDVLDDAFCLDVELPSNRVLWPCWHSLDAFQSAMSSSSCVGLISFFSPWLNVNN